MLGAEVERFAAHAPRPLHRHKDQLLARLKRIEGQIRGIEGMVQDDRYCIDILTQITAAQGRAGQGRARAARRTCPHVRDLRRARQQDERTKEMMAAVGRLLRRG
jgi:DNA-binding FrmR family transcriptional regulator